MLVHRITNKNNELYNTFDLFPKVFWCTFRYFCRLPFFQHAKGKQAISKGCLIKDLQIENCQLPIDLWLYRIF